MKSRFGNYPNKPKSQLLLNAYIILCNAHSASSSFFDIFDKTHSKHKSKSMPTDEEQDLLRAMLIFAASGLDSMVKQLVRESLASVIETDDGAKKQFMDYIEKRLRRTDQLDMKLLVSAMMRDKPRAVLIEELVRELTSSSLQSREELIKVAAFFNIPSRDLTTELDLLKTIFDARNQIVHEIDIDFSQSNVNRRPRNKADMVKYTEELLRIAKQFLHEVDRKI